MLPQSGPLPVLMFSVCFGFVFRMDLRAADANSRGKFMGDNGMLLK